MKVVILGAGGVGRVIAHELQDVPEIAEFIIADCRAEAAAKVASELAHPHASAVAVDGSSREELTAVCRDAWLVFNALPPEFNDPVLDVAWNCGAHYLDMASGTVPGKTIDDCVVGTIARDSQWRDKGLIALINTGITPGITNIVAADIAEALEPPLGIVILSYGSVTSRIKFSLWSPQTYLQDTAADPLVYEERRFRRARPFEGQEEIEVPHLGRGIAVFHEHEEVSTFPRFIDGVSDVAFKMGDPGILKTKALHDAGMMSDEPITAKGTAISPLEFLIAMAPPTLSLEDLADALQTGDVDNGASVRLVEIEGGRDSERVKLRRWILVPDLRAAFAAIWGANHMSYATGVSAAAFARAIIAGNVGRTGVFPPECLDGGAREFVFGRVVERGFVFLSEEVSPALVG